MSAPEQVVRLVEQFIRNQGDYVRPGYKEAQARREFIDPFFEALGWDIANRSGYAEAYKDVVHEDSLDVEGETKAPDYCFRIGGTRKFFVEAKSPSTNIFSGGAARDAAFQVKRYSWSAKLPLGILTNFHELAVYDTTRQPKPNDSPALTRIIYIKCDEYLEKWDEIAKIFSKQAILLGSFDRYAQAKEGRRGTAQVDGAFLKEIEAWRADLAADIARRNRDIATRQLNYSVQAIIDRIVFLRICEDRGLEEYEELKKAAVGVNVYQRLWKLFDEADDVYNSGLFHFRAEPGREFPDTLTPALRLDDKLLRSIINGLYYPSPFQFSVIPPDILGQVYEQFLGKVIVVDSRHRASVEDKPEVAKAGGVYYTPSYIVSDIVSKTVGVALESRTVNNMVLGGRRRNPFRVVDPACGSGSFLIQVYEYLLVWYLAEYSKDSERWSKGRAARLMQDQRGEWVLTISERKRILLEHVFGVDIDSQAVEVTKLSLLLKVLEGQTEATVHQQLQLFRERALPDLDQNIKCGNSLVEPDVYGLGQLGLWDDEDRYRVNAFSWGDEFPDAMADGGFDVVLGNPPYVYRNATEERLRPYYDRAYRCVQGNYDLYKFFLERGLSLVRRKGSLGYIVSASFLVQPTFSRLRGLLLQDSVIEHLAPMGPGVFSRAAVDSCIVVLRHDAVRSGSHVSVRAPGVPMLLPATPSYEIPQARFASNPGQVFDYRLTEEAAPIVDRLFNSFPAIESGFEFGVGINTGFVRAEMTADHKADSRWHPMVPGSGISPYAPVRTEGWILYDRDWVRAQGSRGRSLPPERFFTENKILVVRTRNLALARRVIATLDTTKSYNLNRLSNIIARPGHNLWGLLGILNSSLFNWLFSTRFYDYEIKPVYLRQAPLADDGDANLVIAVQEMVKATTTQEAARTAMERSYATRLVELADRRVNQEVFRIYGINSDEQHLIEEQMRLAFAFEAPSGTDEVLQVVDQLSKSEQRLGLRLGCPGGPPNRSG